MPIELDEVERRILGVLLEKQRTVPDTYPLSLNALRTACNQATSRDPVTSYDDTTLTDGLRRLRDRELVRYVVVRGSRVVKYHQRLEEHLALDAPAAALIAVLLLRGPQTAGELRPRTERLHAFADRDAVEASLQELAARPEPLVRELDRQPGQHDRRWVHLLRAHQADEPAHDAPPIDRESVLNGGAGARDRAVAAGYDEIAAGYADAADDELDGQPFDRWLLEHAAETAEGGQGLDVGCGPGHIAAHLVQSGVAMTGLDISAAMIAEGRRRHPDVTFVQGGFDVPPMPRGGDPRDPGWDLVVAYHSFVHLAASELTTTVAALARVLRRGGRLLIALSSGDGTLRVETLHGQPTDLTFVLHDPADVLAAVRNAGLLDVEWYRRGPLSDEAQSDRLYVLARKPALR